MIPSLILRIPLLRQTSPKTNILLLLLTKLQKLQLFHDIQYIQQSVDPYLSPNESTKPKQHVDKIDGLAESFIRTCRFVECFSNYLNLLSL